MERAPPLDTWQGVATGHREQTQDNPRTVPGLRRARQAETARSADAQETVKSQQAGHLHVPEGSREAPENRRENIQIRRAHIEERPKD